VTGSNGDVEVFLIKGLVSDGECDDLVELYERTRTRTRPPEEKGEEETSPVDGQHHTHRGGPLPLVCVDPSAITSAATGSRPSGTVGGSMCGMWAGTF
jgi:hypothetical protein